MKQTTMDRWMEAAEAKRVCDRAMDEQTLRHFVWSMPQPWSLMTKLRAAMMSDAVRQRSMLDPKARPAG